MKKLLHDSKYWLLASVISFSAYAFLQIDNADQNRPQAINYTQLEQSESNENEEDKMIDLDVIKSVSQFVVDVIRLNF